MRSKDMLFIKANGSEKSRKFGKFLQTELFLGFHQICQIRFLKLRSCRTPVYDTITVMKKNKTAEKRGRVLVVLSIISETDLRLNFVSGEESSSYSTTWQTPAPYRRQSACAGDLRDHDTVWCFQHAAGKTDRSEESSRVQE